MLDTIRDRTEDIFMPLGGFGLFLVAFFSSTFLLVPPDIILALMCINATGDPICIWYATVCTFGSVLGGMFGYYLGYNRGRPFLEKLITENRICQVEEAYTRFGMWAIGFLGSYDTLIIFNVPFFSSSSSLRQFIDKMLMIMMIPMVPPIVIFFIWKTSITDLYLKFAL